MTIRATVLFTAALLFTAFSATLPASAANLGNPASLNDKAPNVYKAKFDTSKGTFVIEVHRESFRRAVDAGVNIAMGTDSAVTPHGENLDELSLMVADGQTPEQAFASATMGGARLMGLDHELGSLEPGKLADLVISRSDPLAFDTLRAGIEQVWKGGSRVVGG